MHSQDDVGAVKRPYCGSERKELTELKTMRVRIE